jgi:hypothetical protein
MCMSNEKTSKRLYSDADDRRQDLSGLLAETGFTYLNEKSGKQLVDRSVRF